MSSYELIQHITLQVGGVSEITGAIITLNKGQLITHLIFPTAISSWKAASSKLNISKATAPYGNIVIISKNYGNTGWDAMTYINLRIEIQDNVTSSNRSELVAHELGHGFGLGHYSCSSELMRAVGYKGSASPYEGDIAGINSLY